MKKILLNKNRSKTSINETNIIPVDINRDMSMFHDEILTDTVNTMQVYNDEKDSCTKHRFIFTLKPYMTNVLFNKITEIVINEGSLKYNVITNKEYNDVVEFFKNKKISTGPLTHAQFIRNTEYSNNNECTYHCGLDIFNNHLLRKKEDISIQKINESNNNNWFNTIGDYLRNSDGNGIKGLLATKGKLYTYESSEEKQLPVYTSETIESFHDAIIDGLKIKDGWVGFTNPSTIKIDVNPNNTGYYVNKCINNKDACQFIDLAPERDLFYFTPKYNKHRNRLEHNWRFYITYPAESIYIDGIPLSIDSTDIKTITNNIPFTIFRTIYNHNVKKGDVVNVYFVYKDGDEQKQIVSKCVIRNIGDINGENKNRHFSIYNSDIETSDFKIEDNKFKVDDKEIVSESIVGFYFKKIENGYECEYYYRKLKVLDEMSNKNYIVNKLAFSNTIYGDEVSQLVYTNSFDIANKCDNRGRPLTELYLTIVKTNDGYKKWYENIEEDSDITYSHVFGKVTSGFDLNLNDYVKYPVIRRMHNISGQESDSEWEKIKKNKTLLAKIPKSSKAYEEITKDTSCFTCDIVEFNPISLKETQIEEILYRFNTAQREVVFDTTSFYSTIKYDEIVGDTYDISYSNKNTSDITLIGKDGVNYIGIKTNKLHEGYANLGPEGYIYKPHYKIQIGEYEDTVNQASDTKMIYNKLFIKTVKESNNTGTRLYFETNDNYHLMPGDLISILDTITNKYYKLRVSSYEYTSNDEGNFVFRGISHCFDEKVNINDINVDSIVLFKHNLSIPDYAYLLPDGSGRHLWRNIKKPSIYQFTDNLYEVPFTNGNFYHHMNIDFYLKRQDPYNKFKMYVCDSNGGRIEDDYAISSEIFIPSDIEYVPENNYTSCF